MGYWSDTNQEMLRAGIALGERFGLCRYEDLVQGGEEVLRELLDFLDEPWASEVTEHHRVQREKGAPRAAEGSTITSRPVDASRATAWVATVGPEDLRELSSVSGLASFFGYDATSPEIGAAWSTPGEQPVRVVTGRHLAERPRTWATDVSAARGPSSRPRAARCRGAGGSAGPRRGRPVPGQVAARGAPGGRPPEGPARPVP